MSKPPRSSGESRSSSRRDGRVPGVRQEVDQLEDPLEWATTAQGGTSRLIGNARTNIPSRGAVSIRNAAWLKDVPNTAEEAAMVEVTMLEVTTSPTAVENRISRMDHSQRTMESSAR